MSVVGDVMGAMETFTMSPRGPFSLAASIQFLEGFTPAAYGGPQAAPDPVLELAFPMEGSWQTVGVRVRQQGDEVTAEVVSPGGGRWPGAGPAAAGRADLVRRRGRLGLPRGR